MATVFQFCPSCGADISSAQDRHCRECGAAVATDPSTEPMPPPQTNAYVTATPRYEDKVAYYAAADPDIYVRIDGRRHDEVDSHTECKPR
jgi:hypothetical protein